MKKADFAVIDIGSNSIRYLGSAPEKRLVTTRLAEGLVSTGTLSEAAMERSVTAITSFAEKARAEGLVPAAYATSAVRDARNSADFLARVEAACGVRIDVLSGEREAQYARLGAAEEGGIVDIGGGSSQLVTEGFAASYPVGCVRAKEWGEQSGAQSFDALQEALFSRFMGIYRFPRLFVPHWTGVGGTITTVAALSRNMSVYDRSAVASIVLSQEDVEAQAHALYAMGDAERAQHPLLAERHDVIVEGALILLYIMRGMGIYELHVSDADGMEGYRAYLQSANCES